MEDFFHIQFSLSDSERAAKLDKVNRGKKTTRETIL